MADLAFREKVEETPEVLPEGKTPDRSGDEGEKIEVPYLDYETQNHHPYSVDYFGLGDTWDDPNGGFPEEIAVIEEYVEKKIQSGEMANSRQAVNDFLKGVERITKVNKEERPIVKVETISAYIKFLMETDKIKWNMSRYGRASRWR